jgi:hypothetical protein
MDDVAQVSVIPNMPSAVLLRWSKADGQVLALTLLMVKLVTLISIILVVNRVHHDCCVQHRLEVLYMHVDLFIILRQVGSELVNDHS